MLFFFFFALASLLTVRAKLYELLAHCIPPEMILKTLTLELLRKLDAQIKNDVIETAAFYVHHTQRKAKEKRTADLPVLFLFFSLSLGASDAGWQQADLSPRGVRRKVYEHIQKVRTPGSLFFFLSSHPYYV